jgi:DNA polymerase family A
MHERCLIEFDKAGAEWVVVAYCCGSGRMIDICESGQSPHLVTGSYLTGAPQDLIQREAKRLGMMNDPLEIDAIRRKEFPQLLADNILFLPRSMSIRQAAKKANHGLNYMEGPGVFALTNEMDESDAKKIIYNYTQVAYPDIPVWWEAVKRQLRKDRTLTNCFGRRRRFMDQWGHELFKQGIAFIPQSTVADIVLKGMCQTYSDEHLAPAWDLLANVYDSLLFQVEFREWKVLARDCIKVGLNYMNPVCTYAGRDFQIGTDLKIGKSWGKMHEVKLSRDADKVAKDLRAAWESSKHAKGSIAA